MEVSNHFIAFRGGANGPAGLLLAINPHQVVAITSAWDKQHAQNVLRLHLVNRQYITVFESDADNVLEELGLSQYTGAWVLDLERDV